MFDLYVYEENKKSFFYACNNFLNYYSALVRLNLCAKNLQTLISRRLSVVRFDL